LQELDKEHKEELKKINEQYRKEQMAFFSSLMGDISQIFADDTKRIIDNAGGDLEKLRGDTQLTTGLIASGLGGAISGIFNEMENGKLTTAGFFKSILKGAMSVLPALLTMKSALNPFAVLGITAAVTGTMAAINAMTRKQQAQNFYEGGLVQGSREKDSIPANLHHLEYIVPAEQTKKHYPKLEKLRKTGL
jgi:hypothetical protein